MSVVVLCIGMCVDVLHLCLDVMSVINSSLLPSSRPLPDEMIKYAREDTHYLLYIYDRMKNELIRRSNTGTDNLLNTVIERSTEICLKVSFTFQYCLMYAV